MRKQSDQHVPSRVRESETQVNNLPAPAFSESRPKGVLDRSHPGHITRGAAESATDPVHDAHEGTRTTPSRSKEH
ncbi:MAG TPA: hypothetical protein VGG26_00240 [Terracidiphilus sp.]|jgi:hypothetical protein